MSNFRRTPLTFSVSQNFLTSKKMIERLLNKTTIAKNDIVLEIGAGKGHITKALASRCAQVIAYEIDPQWYRYLKPQLPSHVDLRCADFLTSPLPRLPYKVFSNIPFSITTSIIKKLMAAPPLPAAIWLVMEKGAAMRFCGFPHDTLQSLQLKPFFNVSILYRFQRTDFHPAPSVETVLIQLLQKPIPDILLEQRKEFSAFLAYHRKYGLFSSHSLLTKKQISTALRFAKLPQIERSGDVLYVQWLCLFRCWLQFRK